MLEAIISGIYLGVEFYKEKRELSFPHGWLANRKLHEEDMHRIRMGELKRKQYVKNLERGKYRDLEEEKREEEEARAEIAATEDPVKKAELEKKLNDMLEYREWYLKEIARRREKNFFDYDGIDFY